MHPQNRSAVSARSQALHRLQALSRTSFHLRSNSATAVCARGFAAPTNLTQPMTRSRTASLSTIGLDIMARHRNEPKAVATDSVDDLA